MAKLAVAAILLLAVGANAALDGKHLYNCVNNAGYTYLKKAIDIAGLKPVLTNSSLAVTLFAPDNQAFLDLADRLELTIDQLLTSKNKETLKNTLLYHVTTTRTGRVLNTDFWPAYDAKSKLVWTALPKPNKDDVWKLTVYSDADGDYQVEGMDNDAELNCNNVNLKCGAGIMLSIDEVLRPFDA